MNSMRTVGKRNPSQGLEKADEFLKLARELRKGRPFVRKGVYRFKSFEEAHAASLDAQAGRVQESAAVPRRRKR